MVQIAQIEQIEQIGINFFLPKLFENLLLIFGSIISYFLLYYLFKLYISFSIIKFVENKNKSKIIFIRNIAETKLNKMYYNAMNYIFGVMVSINDESTIRNILADVDLVDRNLEIIIESVGGSISSNESIINMLGSFRGQINVYIINYAWSAATMISLASDNIYMNKFASIGPTDPQIYVLDNMVSLRSVTKLVESKSINKISDEILINYYDTKSLHDINCKYITLLVNKHSKKNVSKEKINKLIKDLSDGDLPHHTAFMYDMIKDTLNVTMKIPYDITKVYGQIKYAYYFLY
jgi:hypothetical protein